MNDVAVGDAFLSPCGYDRSSLLTEPFEAATVLVAYEVALRSGHILNDAPIDRVEVSADCKSLPLARVAARRRYYRFGSPSERDLDHRHYWRQNLTRLTHCPSDKLSSLLWRGVSPVDVDDTRHFSHRACVRLTGDAPQLCREHRHGSVEPFSRAEVQALLDGGQQVIIEQGVEEFPGFMHR